MEIKDIFYKGPIFVSYLIKKLHEKNPEKSIGKTAIQKLTFLCINNFKNTINYSFNLHYYGPYSEELSSSLNFAENKGFISIDWDSKNGYIIENKNDKFDELSTEDIQAINWIVDKYGDYERVIDLSIIATAVYIKNMHGVKNEDLPTSINNLKPELGVEYIKKILEEKV